MDRVSEKVDATIAQASEEDQPFKPSELVKNLRDIKTEHSTIAKQLEDLKETHNQFVTDILKDLDQLKEAESQLLAKVGNESIAPKKWTIL